jgi:hypothetical protein
MATVHSPSSMVNLLSFQRARLQVGDSIIAIFGALSEGIFVPPGKRRVKERGKNNFLAVAAVARRRAPNTHGLATVATKQTSKLFSPVFLRA